jgi:hypothetical protein
MGRIVELVVALDVERQLKVLRASSPTLGELPITPLRGVDDLVRLEFALQRFREIHRSRRSKELFRAVRTILDAGAACENAPPQAAWGCARNGARSAMFSPL